VKLCISYEHFNFENSANDNFQKGKFKCSKLKLLHNKYFTNHQFPLELSCNHVIKYSSIAHNIQNLCSSG